MERKGRSHQRVDAREDGAHFGRELPRALGRHHPPGRAYEERVREHPPQPSQGVAGRRLGHLEALRRSRDVLFLGERTKYAEKREIQLIDVAHDEDVAHRLAT